MQTPPHTLLGIDHVVILVDDMDLALDFYLNTLGCRPAFSYPAIGMEQVWAGTEIIALWDISNPKAARAVPPVAGGRNMDHVALAIGPCDFDALRDWFTARDVRMDETVFQGGARGMGQALYVYDPFGNRIELKGPPVYPDGTAT